MIRHSSVCMHPSRHYYYCRRDRASTRKKKASPARAWQVPVRPSVRPTFQKIVSCRCTSRYLVCVTCGRLRILRVISPHVLHGPIFTSPGKRNIGFDSSISAACNRTAPGVYARGLVNGGNNLGGEVRSYGSSM